MCIRDSDERAAEAIAACLDEGAEPVLVTYVMTYAGLRPAYDITLAVDWTKIYHSLQSRMTANAWFVAADVQALSLIHISGSSSETAHEGAPSVPAAPVVVPPVQVPPRASTFDDGDDLDVPDFLK